MNVYLGKDRKNATQILKATHTTVRSLTRRVEGVGHEIYMDNSPPQLYLMTCTQEVSTVVGVTDKIINKCQRALTRRH
jgi:predicted nucleotidyltransferase